MELMGYFREPEPDQLVRAIPGAGLDPEIWILGSSLFGAQLAAALGLPYAFASHFAPQAMMQALDVYRERFTPSDRLDRPRAMLGVNIIAAESDDDAQVLLTSLQQAFLNIRRGQPTPLPPPDERLPERLTPAERAGLQALFAATVAGSADTVRDWVTRFLSRTGADELIVASQIFDHAARLRSYELTAEALALTPAAPSAAPAPR